jgi:hypothetical protein
MSDKDKKETGEEFRYLQGWLAFSERLDRLIEAAEVATNVDSRRS